MKIDKWLLFNTGSLSGRTVAITGSTGGIGKELCKYLASLGASLILVDRNRIRSLAHREELISVYPGAQVKCITADLEDIASVKEACLALSHEALDVFIHNAGAYSIPRHKCAGGYDNVFQINFASPYYMIRELLPVLRERLGRVIVVGSIAHNYSKIDVGDIDFSTRKQASKVYGNAKRYLMFSLYELFARESGVDLAVTHPGICFTNITAHYPKALFAVIKGPMKLIFMHPRKACLSVLHGIYNPCAYHEWIGPRAFDVWGMPRKKKLRTCRTAESRRIGEIAEEVYLHLKEL